MTGHDHHGRLGRLGAFVHRRRGRVVLGWIAALIWTIVEASTKPTVEQQWVEAMAAMHSGRLVLDDEETIPQQKYTL